VACGCASLVRCTVKGARSKLNRSVSPEKLPNSSHADQLIVLIFVRVVVLSYESIFVSYESTSGSTFVRKYVYTYCSLLAIGHMFSPDGYRAQVFLYLIIRSTLCSVHVRKYFGSTEVQRCTEVPRCCTSGSTKVYITYNTLESTCTLVVRDELCESMSKIFAVVHFV
jgi:hypothetical protein